jgi:hypothetical protein
MGYTPLAFFRVHPDVRCLGANSRASFAIRPTALADRYRRRPRLLVIPASLAIVGRAAQVVKVSVGDRGQPLKLWFALQAEFALQNTTCSWATEAFMSFRQPWPGARYRRASSVGGNGAAGHFSHALARWPHSEPTSELLALD